ncbi:hypothetical protein VTL71DRAFT_14183 [Oculimacula yallundae]|uniref:Uncharacterized protein n=1 Tax=Oculimacula yallundae TaxID=86028 RepID=A0ABR4CHQ7_9HELO
MSSDSSPISRIHHPGPGVPIVDIVRSSGLATEGIPSAGFHLRHIFSIYYFGLIISAFLSIPLLYISISLFWTSSSSTKTNHNSGQ